MKPALYSPVFPCKARPAKISPGEVQLNLAHLYRGTAHPGKTQTWHGTVIRGIPMPRTTTSSWILTCECNQCRQPHLHTNRRKLQSWKVRLVVIHQHFNRGGRHPSIQVNNTFPGEASKISHITRSRKHWPARWLNITKQLLTIAHAHYRMAVLRDGVKSAVRIGRSQKAEACFLTDTDILWGLQVAVMFQIISTMALDCHHFWRLWRIFGVYPRMCKRGDYETWGHMDHSDGHCYCRSSDRTSVELALMSRDLGAPSSDGGGGGDSFRRDWCAVSCGSLLGVGTSRRIWQPCATVGLGLSLELWIVMDRI